MNNNTLSNNVSNNSQIANSSRRKRYMPGDWVCASCSMDNFAARTNCLQCGSGSQQALERPADRPGDWKCEAPTCMYHNYASRCLFGNQGRTATAARCPAANPVPRWCSRPRRAGTAQTSSASSRTSTSGSGASSAAATSQTTPSSSLCSMSRARSPPPAHSTTCTPPGASFQGMCTTCGNDPHSL